MLSRQFVKGLLSCAAVGVISASTTLGAEKPSVDQTFTQFARYGADVWARNPSARISGEGKACISCHTSLPYALVEPLLPGQYAAYSDLIDNVSNRARTWADNTPWYSDEKLEKAAALSGAPPDVLKDLLDATDSRGVEAVMNALILATHDAYSRTQAQRATQQAFDNLWAEQIQDGPAAGRWHWIDANLVPWEVADSDIWGAALACVAASIFPDLAPPQHLELLRQSLKNAAEDREVSLHGKAAVLWCNSESEERFLENSLAQSVIAELLNRQHANGGWALREIGPWIGWEGSRSDCCAKRDIRPDAYATGFVALVLARSDWFASDDHPDSLGKAMVWIDRQLADPYPSEPLHNRHDSAEQDLPEFRNNLYTHAGHMWAYLARTALKTQKAPWARD